LALLAVVVGVTAALASYAPPTVARSGPFSAEERIGPALLELAVEPARVGVNEIHVYLFDARSGAPFARTEELRLTATRPGGGESLPLEPEVSGPGHFTVPSALLNAAGEWRLEVTVRVSAFDQFSRTLTVPVE
jgi:copper transport protein